MNRHLAVLDRPADELQNPSNLRPHVPTPAPPPWEPPPIFNDEHSDVVISAEDAAWLIGHLNRTERHTGELAALGRIRKELRRQVNRG